MAEVQLLLKRVMAHKKATSRKKEMRILQVTEFPVNALRSAHACHSFHVHPSLHSEKAGHRNFTWLARWVQVQQLSELL